MATPTRSWRPLAMAIGALLLAVGFVAPQAVAAGSNGMLTNVSLASGVAHLVVTFDVGTARTARLDLWSDSEPQSRRSVDESSPRTHHSFAVTGLQPDTRYHVQIKLDEASVWVVAYVTDLRTLPRDLTLVARIAPFGSPAEGEPEAFVHDVDIVDVLTNEGWVLHVLSADATRFTGADALWVMVPHNGGMLYESAKILAYTWRYTGSLVGGTYSQMETVHINGMPYPFATSVLVGAQFAIGAS